MPMVPTVPSMRSHSCSFVNRRSVGVVMCQVSAFVEWRSYDSSFRQFAAYAYMKSRSDCGVFGRHVREADVLLQSYRRRTACDMSHFLVVNKHRIVIACDIAANHFEPHKSAFHAVLFLFQQCVAADEVAFIVLDDPPEPRFE